MSDNTPAIFIAPVLASAFGEWVKVTSDTDPDELHAIGRKWVAELNKLEGHENYAEEYWVSDSENFVAKVGEHADFEYVVWLATLTEEVGDDAEAFEAWVANEGQERVFYDGKRRMDPDEIVEAFREKFRGTYKSVEDYAYEVVQGSYDIDKMLGNLAVYFDYASFGRDLVLGGDIWTADVTGGEVAIFDNH